MTLRDLYARIDTATTKAVVRSGNTPPCCAGCFHCCREPVATSLSEVRFLLEPLTPHVRLLLANKVRAWLERFLAEGWQERVGMGKDFAFSYRRMLLWCPLLEGGLCSVYERRPYSCRVHIAMATKDGCEQDHLRPRQKFAEFPGLDQNVIAILLQNIPESGEEIFDDLGILLARELLGEDHPTARRLRFIREGETMTCERYGVEEEIPA